LAAMSNGALVQMALVMKRHLDAAA
jgi:hypothetical protein